MMAHVTMLAMVPLFAHAVTGGVLGEAGADGVGLLVSGSGVRRLDDEGSTCSNGFAGVESSSGIVCCVEGCGQCGGSGCSGFLNNEHECCTSAILEDGLSCSVASEAPCYFLDEDSNDDGFSFKGCYEKDGSPDNTHFFGTARMSIEYCYNRCAWKDAYFFAVIDGRECYCGEDEDFLNSDEDGVCDSECSGDEDQTCGGVDAYSLYKMDVLEPTCSNTDDVVGIESESGDVCCALSCGVCDGVACVGTGSCCKQTILDKGITCDDSPTGASCII